MLLQFQVEGSLEIAGFPSICQKEKWINQQEANSFASQEPTSVLHMRRSLSPPTSASTLSSSFNGGALADTTTAATIPPENNAIERKEEWASELQPISCGLELVAGVNIGQRCNSEMEDWENMLSDSVVLPTQDHSFLRWFAGDVDDPSFGLKQLLQSGNGVVTQGLGFEGNAGLGIVDQTPGFDPVGDNSIVGTAGNVISGIGANFGGFQGSGAVPHCNNDCGKTGMVMPTSSAAMGNNQETQNPVFTAPANNIALPVCLPGLYNQQQAQFVDTPEQKPQTLNPQVLMSEQRHFQSRDSFMPFPQEQYLLQPLPPKRHNSGSSDLSSHIPKLPFSDLGHEFLLRKQQQQHMGFPQGLQFLPQQKPMMVTKQKLLSPEEEQQQYHFQLHQQQQQHALLNQLYKAAELVGTGNFPHAQGILARLNQQLSPVGKPLHRAAFYFKEALQFLLRMNNPVSSPPLRNPTRFDIIFKMGAYKAFSEVSPFIQFVNFTCNQALLEALDDANCIHIVDFDIGFGAQWASFMQELPMRTRGAPSLRITAFSSPLTHHPVELGLMRENLTQFANEIGLSFELEVINFDSLGQTSYSLPILRSNENEEVAVNFPIWSSSNQPFVVPSLLRIVKQLSPKIVVSLDTGLDRNDLPFPQHVLYALQSYTNLLESLDAANVTSDAVSKIEQFLFQPRIESTVLGRLHSPDKMPLWKTVFASAGFSPVTFSNFTETQADCLVRRTQARGFHVEKRQASLVLCWQHCELVSASAWRC